jgi:hypothetical protein
MEAPVKEQIHALVDEMTDEEAADLLDYVNMLSDPDELTSEEIAEIEDGKAEVRRGEYITLEELRRKYEL